jgi:hypothetical protein
MLPMGACLGPPHSTCKLVMSAMVFIAHIKQGLTSLGGKQITDRQGGGAGVLHFHPGSAFLLSCINLGKPLSLFEPQFVIC